MQLPKLNNSRDLKQLRQLLDKTEAATRSLQGIGVSSETYGTFLTPVIMTKIPQDLSREPSLNYCLLSGPVLTPLLFDILLRFRLPKIALIGDLETAFPEDRNLLRFLWIDDVNPLNSEIIKLRFTRLVFGLVCSPFILNVTLRNHLSKYENMDPQFVHCQKSWTFRARDSLSAESHFQNGGQKRS